MRRLTCAAAVAGTAAVLLPVLWMGPAAGAAPAAGRPAIAGKSPLVAVRFTCPHVAIARCAKGYRAECTRWAYAGPKGPNMVKCCGRMGCVPFIENPMTKLPLGPPKPLPNTRVK
jgi:hypothetical protein